MRSTIHQLSALILPHKTKLMNPHDPRSRSGVSSCSSGSGKGVGSGSGMGSGSGSGSHKKVSEIICLCNNVTRDTIELAITSGAQTLNEIFDSTTAGVGPCGGSCRRKLGPMLEHYLETKTLLPPAQKPTKRR